jgi:hypothetical protein
MQSSLFRRALLAVTLCSVAWAAFAQKRSLPPPAIQVSVVGGEIRVSTSTLRISADTASLSWQLATEGYRFAAGSIDFGAARARFACTVYDNGRSVRCTKDLSAPSGTFAYTITLYDASGPVELPQPDVFIQND